MFIIILCLLSTIISLWENQRLLGGGGIYLIASNVLIILFALILIYFKRKYFDSYIHKVIYLLLICHTLQVFILYEIVCRYSDTSSMAKDIFLTLLLESITFIVFFIIGKYFKITLFKIASLISFIALPLSIVAMSLGGKSGGSYFIIKICGFSVVSLAIISLLMPFSLAFTMDVFKNWWHTRITHLKMYHLMLLFYFGFISLLLVRNKDLGSLMVLSIILIIIMIPTLPHFVYKLLLALTSICTVTILYFCSKTFQDRVNDLTDLKGDTFYFLQQYRRSGLWGNGYGYQHLRFSKLGEDYALNAVFSNHGFLLTIAILFILMILLHQSYTMISVMHHNNFIAILLKCNLLTIIIPYLYCTLSSLLLLPVTGIPFPFLGNSTSLSLVYTYNIALILGFFCRKEHAS